MSLKYQTKPNSGFGICATNLSACQPKDNQLLITPRCRDVSVHQFLWGDNYTNHWQSTKGLFLPAQCWGREGKEETNSSKVTKVKKISLNLLQHTMLEYRISLILLVVTIFALILPPCYFLPAPKGCTEACQEQLDPREWLEKKKKRTAVLLWLYFLLGKCLNALLFCRIDLYSTFPGVQAPQKCSAKPHRLWYLLLLEQMPFLTQTQRLLLVANIYIHIKRERDEVILS